MNFHLIKLNCFTCLQYSDDRSYVQPNDETLDSTKEAIIRVWSNQVSQTCNLNAKYFETFKTISANPAKYFTKKFAKRSFKFSFMLKVWSCNRSLSNIKGYDSHQRAIIIPTTQHISTNKFIKRVLNAID